MTDGPVEVLLVHFPDNRFRPELVASLIDLVELGTIRLLDLVVIRKDNDGTVTSLEIDDLEPETRELFFDLDGEYDGLISDEDITLAGADLPGGTSAAMLIWENTWAARFAAALRDSGADVVVHDRLPQPVVEEALAALSGDAV